MTDKQALTQARKRWGKKAYIVRTLQGGFIDDDGKWRASHFRVCKHHGDTDGQKTHPRNCPRDYYVARSERCQHCKNGRAYELARVRYPVAGYKVGILAGVAGMQFFDVKGEGESYEAAFAEWDTRVATEKARLNASAIAALEPAPKPVLIDEIEKAVAPTQEEKPS